MSAFIVQDSTINKILSYLSVHANKSGFSHVQHTVKEKWGYSLEKKHNLQALGQALLQLNRRAVNARYKEAEATEAFTFRLGLTSLDLPSVIKAVSCLKYQCSEGNIPEEPLYQLLVFLEHQLAMVFVHQSAAYGVAPWG